MITAGSDDEDEGSEAVRVCPGCASNHGGEPAYCSDFGEPLGPADDRSVGHVLRSGSRGYCSDCKSRVDRDADACPDCGCVLRAGGRVRP